jgi:glycosyltransferase involved in cell wall biosynthesis
MKNQDQVNQLKNLAVAPCNQSSLSVLFIVGTKIYPFNTGGTEIASFSLIRALHKQRCKVYVITGYTNTQRAHIEIPFKLFRIKTGNIPIIRSIIYFIGSFFTTLKLRSQIDIIHIQPIFPLGLVGIILGRIIKKPTIVYARGADLDVHSYRFKSVIGWIINKASFAIALHKKHKERMQKISNRKQIEVIPNGVSLSKDISCNQEKFLKKTNLESVSFKKIKIVAYCGRLSKVKGIDYLIPAIPSILKNAQNTYFLFIGEGELEKQLKNCENSNHILLTGKIAHEEVFGLLKCADIFVLPSIREASSNALLEAMAVGLPIVATNVGGNPAMVAHGRTGILINPRDSVAIANAILDLLLNPQLRNKFKENTLKFIENFSWEKISKKLICIYHKTLKSEYKTKISLN